MLYRHDRLGAEAVQDRTPTSGKASSVRLLRFPLSVDQLDPLLVTQPSDGAALQSPPNA
jgi:hypothetical protein